MFPSERLTSQPEDRLKWARRLGTVALVAGAATAGALPNGDLRTIAIGLAVSLPMAGGAAFSYYEAMRPPEATPPVTPLDQG